MFFEAIVNKPRGEVPHAVVRYPPALPPTRGWRVKTETRPTSPSRAAKRTDGDAVDTLVAILLAPTHVADMPCAAAMISATNY